MAWDCLVHHFDTHPTYRVHRVPNTQIRQRADSVLTSSGSFEQIFDEHREVDCLQGMLGHLVDIPLSLRLRFLQCYHK